MNKTRVARLSFLQELDAHCARCNRDPKTLVCLAVSKNNTLDAVHRVYTAGIVHFGENRLQEAQKKYAGCSFRDAIKLHFLGPIQTNKITKIVQFFDYIQSVDSFPLCTRIESAAQRLGTVVPLCLQLNLDPAKKTGFADVKSLFEAAAFCARSRHVQLKGVMGIASHSNDADQLRSEFRDLYKCYTSLQNQYGVDSIEYCSMGMSNDYAIAIQEGSTMVRIGRKIFDAN